MLARAKAIAAALGIRINAAGYEKHTVTNDADYEARQSQLRSSVEPALAAAGRGFGGNPLEAFREIARDLPKARDSEVQRGPSASLALDAEPEAVRAALAIRNYPEAGSGEDFFYCMEPYKTLYVHRDGAAKPCCEASTEMFLGDLKKEQAIDIWNATGYDEVRDGIARQEYPAFCVDCLKNKSAPDYYIGPLVDNYVAWNEATFGPALRDALARQAPEAQRIIRHSSPEAMMALVRQRTHQD